MLAILVALLAPLLAIQVGLPKPCEAIGKPANQPVELRNFASLTTVGSFHIRALEGQTSCDFPQLGSGRCRLSDPKVIFVQNDGQDAWFEIPKGQPVQIQLEDGSYTCTVGRTVRTD